MPICANCGAQQPEGVAFCDECGAPLRSQQVPAQPSPAAGQARTVVASNVCPVCGARTSPQDPFCSNCGAALREAASGVVADGQPQNIPQQQAISQPPAEPWPMPAPGASADAPTAFGQPGVSPPQAPAPQAGLGATVVSGQGGRGMAGGIPPQELYGPPGGLPSADANLPAPGPLICTNCGAKLEPDSAFCDMCGAPVRPPASQSAPALQQVPQPRTASGSQVWGPPEPGAGPSAAEPTQTTSPPAQTPDATSVAWGGELGTSQSAPPVASGYEDV